MFIYKNDKPFPAFETDTLHRVSLIACTAGILVAGIASVFFHAIEKYSFGV